MPTRKYKRDSNGRFGSGSATNSGKKKTPTTRRVTPEADAIMRRAEHRAEMRAAEKRAAKRRHMDELRAQVAATQ